MLVLPEWRIPLGLYLKWRNGSKEIRQYVAVKWRSIRCHETCDFCNRVDFVFETKPSKNTTLNLGSINDIKKADCPKHGELLLWLSKRIDLSEPGNLSASNWDDSSTYFYVVDPLDIFRTMGSADQHLSVEKTEDNCDYATGVRLDKNWIEGSRAVQWYNNCINDHDGCADPDYLAQIPQPVPQFFVDTVQMCLIPAPAHTSYIALSYVWGKTEMLKTTMANVEKLQKTNSLRIADTWSRIPRTIRHAISLLHLFGERYLWVDTLCIVQDNEVTFKDQINQMASIFAHATAVIAAMDGADADHGLRGLKELEDAEERAFDQRTISFGTKTLLERETYGEGIPDSKNQVYVKRAWTFQEYFFARRKICFQNDSIWHGCCKSEMYEDSTHPERPHTHRNWTFEVGYPALNIYYDMAADFNIRQFSYPQDCLSAFAGLLACYSKPFKGGFLCGLPELFFDCALLWHPDGELERRVPVTNNNSTINAEACLPSWSWVGWCGKIDFDYWSTGNDWVAACRGLIAHSQCQTYPITTWYTADSSEATERRRIDVEWATWRELYKDLRRELPPGWTKKRKRPNEGLTIEEYPDGYGEFLYQHESCSAMFWFPIPLCDPAPQPELKPDTRYLFATVQSAHLRASGSEFTKARSTWRSKEANNFCLSLRDANGQWAGLLRLHRKDQFRDYANQCGHEDAAIHLIALSRGSISNKHEPGYGSSNIEEYDMEQRPKQGKIYEYYNVMWVSWRGGIAYREAIGRVYRPIWEALKPKDIDIVLG